MKQQKNFPWLTIVLVVANLVVWALFSMPSQQHADSTIASFAFTPARLTQANEHGDSLGIMAEGYRMVTSLFVHEHDHWHALLNMLFLLGFGLAIERRLGTKRFALLYFAAGVLTCVVYYLICPDGRASYGASAAVCGVMGAYIVLFLKRHPCVSLIPIGALVLTVIGAMNPAVLAQTGFAMWAHMSGFMIGMLAAAMMTLEVRVTPKPAR